MAASLWTPDAPGRPAPDPGPALVQVALRAGATSVAHVDVAAMLSGLCVALVPAAGVAGAVLVLHEPADARDPERRRVFGSDTAATRIGQLQDRSGAGPAISTAHDGRVCLTPDLTRSDPPGLAAVAAGCGLVRALTVPVVVGGRTAGALQLLGRRDCGAPLGERLAAALQVVTAALAARIRDVRELTRLEQLTAAGAATDPPFMPPARQAPAGRLPAPQLPAGSRGRAEPPAGPPQPGTRRPATPSAPAGGPAEPGPSHSGRSPDRTTLIPAARRSDGPPVSPRVPAQRRARHRRRDV
ncbi:GAF domain-containing protein [Pseudonocardia sp. NPDC049635]|uniref:GAF domain-containing protein n=1 Tax=Pseudonocardia sp. NPDC049635 TaxID=3155506 RepID=UPI0033D12259